mmetsp:Transcript_4742/g.5460  ORF Transcript_4742/g.5460 Transcript_4742/m.5460 type:complete len:219 (+) Transcript_4742:227-883(+)
MPPATMGEDMEVPDTLRVSMSLPIHAALMAEPGAKIEQQLPNDENDERASLESIAMTAKAPSADGGLRVQESLRAFPAETTRTAPASSTASIASFKARSTRPKLRDILPTTLFLVESALALLAAAATSSSAAKMPLRGQLPLRVQTFWAINVLARAVPYSRPPAVEATWVPCPFSSFSPSPTWSPPPTHVARPPKSSCVVRMPVSRTWISTPSPLASR